MKIIVSFKGSASSGNHGHSGRPGKIGGSASTNPYENNAGYTASRKNPYVPGGYLVLYDGTQQGMDVTYGKWQDVCETHGTIASFTSKSKALYHLPTADWCEECMTIARKG